MRFVLNEKRKTLLSLFSILLGISIISFLTLTYYYWLNNGLDFVSWGVAALIVICGILSFIGMVLFGAIVVIWLYGCIKWDNDYNDRALP